jgi:hypothetical protein
VIKYPDDLNKYGVKSTPLPIPLFKVLTKVSLNDVPFYSYSNGTNYMIFYGCIWDVEDILVASDPESETYLFSGEFYSLLLSKFPESLLY